LGLTLGLLGGGWPVYGPAAGAALPGVVILHGGEGPGAGWSHRFAAILAAQGMLALPLSFGTGDVFGAGAIREVDLGIVPAAARSLAAHPRASGRVGLFGWSKGGEMALLVAALGGADFACVAAHAAADRVGNAFDAAAFRAGAPAAAFDPAGPRAWTWAGHDAALEPGAAIAVETYGGPVFLSVGTADEVWDHRMTLRLAARLAAAGRPADLMVAEGQGHGFAFDREPELWARLGAFFGRHLGGTEWEA
jgi:dipeptidyl aminopeptidase/acylaminoacyl peptidase